MALHARVRTRESGRRCCLKDGADPGEILNEPDDDLGSRRRSHAGHHRRPRAAEHQPARIQQHLRSGPAVDQRSLVGDHRRARRRGVQKAFSHSDINTWSDSGGDLTSYYLAAGQSAQQWMDNNPDATDDQKAQAQSDFVAATTSWAQTAVFNAYKNDTTRHPAELINEVHQRIFGTPDPDYKGPLPEGGAP